MARGERERVNGDEVVRSNDLDNMDGREGTAMLGITEGAVADRRHHPHQEK